MIDNSDTIFNRLKEIFIKHSSSLDVVLDESDNFYLNTHHIMKNKKPMFFGSVKINKNHVSFHLMPVYEFPVLLEGISSELKKRMQGKSCFNFKASDEKLFQELQDLTEAGFKKYQKAAYL